MSLIAWNCHGLGDIKLVEHDTMEYIQLFDIVMLTETQTAADVNLMHQLFSVYTLQTIDANSTGRAGEGTLLAVKEQLPCSVSAHSVDTTNSAIFMTLKSCNAQQAPLTVGVCYVPPPGSPPAGCPGSTSQVCCHNSPLSNRVGGKSCHPLG